MNDNAAAGAVRAHGDVALDVLERKLQLLQRQRQISALRCQLFLDQLDLAMAECTLGEDFSDNDGSEDSDDADYADHADCSDDDDDDVSSSEHGGEYDKERNADASLGYVYLQENACNAKGRRPSSSRGLANPSLPPSFSASSSPRAAGNTNDDHHHHHQRFSHNHHLHRNHEQIKGHRSPAGGGSLTASPRGPFSNQQSTESSPRHHTAPVLAARRGVLIHEIVTSRSLSSPITTKLSRGHSHRDINQHSAAASPRMSLKSPPPCSSSCLGTRSTPSSPMAASAEHGTSSPRATAARTFTRHNSDNHRSASPSPRHGPLLSRLGRPSVAVPSRAARVLSRTRTEPASRGTLKPMSLTSTPCGASPPYSSRSPGPPAAPSPTAALPGRLISCHARPAWPDSAAAAAVAAASAAGAAATGHLTPVRCKKDEMRAPFSGKCSSSTRRSCRMPDKYAASASPAHVAAGGGLHQGAHLQWAQRGEVSHASSASDLTSLQQQESGLHSGIRPPASQISLSRDVSPGRRLNKPAYGPGWSHCNQQMLHHLPSSTGNAGTCSDTASLGKCDTLSPGAGNDSQNASATCCACLCEHVTVLQDASTGAAVAAATSETSAPVTAPPVTPATDAAWLCSLATYDSDADVMQWNAHTGYARDDDGGQISPGFSNIGASMAKVSKWLHAHV